MESVVDDAKSEELKSSWRTNLFGVYAKVFKVMLSGWKEKIEHNEEEDREKELEALVLPSNEEWRYQVYYRLVDLQREIDSGLETTLRLGEEGETLEEPKTVMFKQMSLSKTFEWEPTGTSMSFWDSARERSLEKLDSLESGSMTEEFTEPRWRVSDILLTAKVLQKRFLTQVIKFSDEAEMRRVFGLTYDVLRYKQVLNQTLEDSDFWKKYRTFRNRDRIVWLLLYDLQGRRYSRSPQVAIQEARDTAFQEAGIQDIEEALVERKTRIAASVSRLRIGGSALTLEHLLPIHLRNSTGVSWTDESAIASGWVNTLKIPSKSDFINEMSKLNLRLAASNEDLGEDSYIFDPVCPKVVDFFEKTRERIAVSRLVETKSFVFLERTLCLGAAALVRAINKGKLCGPIILTHPVAPRHTGYLAGLLVDIEEAGRLLAFGAGLQRGEYENYLQELGFTEREVRIFAEKYSEAPGFSEMERATIVLATPPCSYTGIRDIVDLSVARGGDTELLESLTTVDDKSQLEQPKRLLAEQLSSLKYALTRPNVQLLIYQVHSVLPSETTEMVEQVVDYANKIATDKYTKEHTKRKSPKDTSPKSAGRSSRAGKQSSIHQDSKSRSHEEEDDEEIALVTDIHVPDSDLFEIGHTNDLNVDESSITIPEYQNGCYLGVVRRKEMMQFNSLFMIKVAESRGLFGDPNAKPKSPEHPEPLKEEPKSPEGVRKKKKKGRKTISLGRITAPTHAFILRSDNRGTRRQSVDDASSGFSWGRDRLSCPKYSQRVAKDECSLSAQVRETRRSDARRWWEQSATFLLHAARCKSCKFRIFHTDPWTRRVLYAPRVQKIVFDGDT
ncbi:uncharacterized protein LOC135167324 [Diachasmimorpha longicaudata]|uniref:uncharacterized protein LOC135167324 n=1 Tax=Diachasmimorpha longicaudata TaxID=58733 RepID=UPI0030B8BD61